MSLPDDLILAGVASVLATQTGQPSFVASAVEGELFVDIDKPFTVVYPVGGMWDRPPLVKAFDSGRFIVQVTSVGEGVDVAGVADYLTMASKARQAIESSVIAGTGWRVIDVDSEGPPIGPEGAGTLRSVAERFSLYVEAV